MFDIRIICHPTDAEPVTSALHGAFRLGPVRREPARREDRERLYVTAEHRKDLTLWSHVRTVTAWLDATNGDGPHEIAMRLLKVTEEAGEAAQAYIGMQGQNPRKGVTATPQDVATELCDVILSAAVALASLTDDPQAAFDAALRDNNHRLRRLTDAGDDEGPADNHPASA
ncbi:MazG-like family protein [Streptomyces sp. NPDC056682]|uniref:MazG-like family protein n=1 Tax=Streptomyces sp. NPDC056682 TaxID=3345909 RepID=UPI003673E0A6